MLNQSNKTILDNTSFDSFSFTCLNKRRHFILTPNTRQLWENILKSLELSFHHLFQLLVWTTQTIYFLPTLADYKILDILMNAKADKGKFWTYILVMFFNYSFCVN